MCIYIYMYIYIYIYIFISGSPLTQERGRERERERKRERDLRLEAGYPSIYVGNIQVGGSGEDILVGGGERWSRYGGGGRTWNLGRCEFT